MGQQCCGGSQIKNPWEDTALPCYRVRTRETHPRAQSVCVRQVLPDPGHARQFTGDEFKPLLSVDTALGVSDGTFHHS